MANENMLDHYIIGPFYEFVHSALSKNLFFFIFNKHRGVNFASHSISVVVLPSPIFKASGYLLYLQLITEDKT